jgi:hypothetical protein
MVTSSEDGTVKIWETRTGNIQRSYNHGSPVNDVVIHPNQGEIISCDRSGSIRIWDLAENQCSHELIPEEDVSCASVTVASDGSLLCAANNNVGHDRAHQVVPLLTFSLGQRLCLAVTPSIREHAAHPRDALQRAQGIHHTHSSLTRRQETRNLQRRPHRQNLGGPRH